MIMSPVSPFNWDQFIFLNHLILILNDKIGVKIATEGMLYKW